MRVWNDIVGYGRVVDVDFDIRVGRLILEVSGCVLKVIL